MRRLIYSLAVLMVANIANAQVAKWLISPNYDDIYMANGEDIIITDSADYYILWSKDGKRLSEKKTDVVSTFYEQYAVTIKKGTDVITGFYDNNGLHTSLNKCRVTYNRPYFYDKNLLVQNEDDTYSFVNQNGIMTGNYMNAYPFRNGYASCSAYRNPQKQKDLYHLLLTKDYEEVSFSYDNKTFDPDDIEFISSVNDENIGIVVINRKVYYFDGKSRRLSPVYAKSNETNIKNQAKLEKDLESCLMEDSETTSVLIAKCGKKDRIGIYFNSLRVPIQISLTDQEIVYDPKVSEPRTYTSPLTMPLDNMKYGIKWEDEVILPPQFDDDRLCFDDKAFVKLNGKCGLLQVFKDEKFDLKINRGDPIAFRHHKYETKIRVDIPTIISSDNTELSIEANSGCDVDLTSAEKKDTEYGNYVQYDCSLSYPSSLPDELNEDDFRNEITYPTQVKYDGLKSPIIPLKVKAWRSVYFDIDIIDTLIYNGELSFSIIVSFDRNGDSEYPLTVMVEKDSITYKPEKKSTQKYKCNGISLKEGQNSIDIQVSEEGCPPVSFPFDITYTKPVAKTGTKPEVKEKVEIKKKVRRTNTSKPVSNPIVKPIRKNES